VRLWTAGCHIVALTHLAELDCSWKLAEAEREREMERATRKLEI
jgi:uncharacterized membrane protein YqjE